MTTATEQQPAAQPIWPQRIEIIGVTGEYASGKTLFALTIDPKNTLIYDTERSSGAYTTLGFQRVSIQDVMQKLKPHGYKPIDVFTWWWEDVKKIVPGKYTVAAIDTISEIEDGLVEWVQKNPTYFGRTLQQYQKMSGLMWGDVKSLWKTILSDLSARVQTFVFCTHMANIWAADRPTGKRKPKGKETLMELASLYLCMQRNPDNKGIVAPKPAAIVLKSRLVHTHFNGESGELELIPCLPPRIPVCTPAEIRKYMLSPPDPNKLSKEERLQEEKLSEDERQAIALAKAQAERDAAVANLEATARQQEMAEAAQQRASSAHAATLHAATVAGQTPPAWPELPGDGGGPKPPTLVSAAQLGVARDLKVALEAKGLLTADGWRSLLATEFAAGSARELTADQGDRLVTLLREKLDAAAATEAAPAEAAPAAAEAAVG